MSNKAPINYYPNKVRDDIEALGLIFDEDAHARAVAVFREQKITQKQHDALVLHHAKEILTVFTPGNYSVKGRIILALHFLGVLNLMKLNKFKFFGGTDNEPNVDAS